MRAQVMNTFLGTLLDRFVSGYFHFFMKHLIAISFQLTARTRAMQACRALRGSWTTGRWALPFRLPPKHNKFHPVGPACLSHKCPYMFSANERTRHRLRQWMEEKCAAARCVFLDKLRGSCPWATQARHASKTSTKGSSSDPSAGIKSTPLSRSTASAIALWRATASKDHQRTEYARSVARRRGTSHPPLRGSSSASVLCVYIEVMRCWNSLQDSLSTMCWGSLL